MPLPDRAWTILTEAHKQAERGPLAAAPTHQPIAAVLACSDARVPPSVIFDQPAGKLFVVRIAGNTASPAALASLDYAVAELGVELVVVLGHTGCGAVQAAVSGTCGGYLAPIVEPICSIARTRPNADLNEIVHGNVACTVAALTDHEGPVGRAARAGAIDVRGAVHDLITGHLETAQTRISTTDRPAIPNHLETR